MNTKTLCHCEDCNALFQNHECKQRLEWIRTEHFGDVQTRPYWHSLCPYCGSVEVGDAEMSHVLAQLDDISGQLKQAIKERNEWQMTAGAFQTQARLAEQRLEQVERELAAYKRHIAEMEVRP